MRSSTRPATCRGSSGKSAALLRRGSTTTFVSSVSVYAPQPGPIDEASPVATLADTTVEDIGEGRYGPLKALSERPPPMRPVAARSLSGRG